MKDVSHMSAKCNGFGVYTTLSKLMTKTKCIGLEVVYKMPNGLLGENIMTN